MKILIIGASGLVGGSCLKVLSDVNNWNVIGTHKSYPTPTTIYFDSENFKPENISFLPNVIIYCGGLTWVDYCEQHPNESYKANVVPIQTLTKWCKSLDAKFIYTSTDYIFDGENGPYKESDHPKPINVYGKHKLLAEDIIKSMLDNYIILRFTNVYGEEARNKNMLSRLIKQVKTSKEEIVLNLANDQFASPIYSQDIGEAIKCLIKDDKKGVFHLSSNDYLSRFEFAKLLINHLSSETIKINSQSTSLLKQKARRPLMGGVLSTKFRKQYPSFKFTSLESYIKKII